MGAGLLGIAMLAANALWGDVSADLSATLVFVGGMSVIGSAAVLCFRLTGEGAPWSVDAQRFLSCEELYFDRTRLREVMRLAERVDLEGLRRLPAQTVPVVAVLVYRTPDDSFAACQVFEYVDLEYRPLCELKVAPAVG